MLHGTHKVAHEIFPCCSGSRQSSPPRRTHSDFTFASPSSEFQKEVLVSETLSCSRKSSNIRALDLPMSKSRVLCARSVCIWDGRCCQVRSTAIKSKNDAQESSSFGGLSIFWCRGCRWPRGSRVPSQETFRACRHLRRVRRASSTLVGPACFARRCSQEQVARNQRALSVHSQDAQKPDQETPAT